jgi:hypothetical protein
MESMRAQGICGIASWPFHMRHRMRRASVSPELLDAWLPHLIIHSDGLERFMGLLLYCRMRNTLGRAQTADL